MCIFKNMKMSERSINKVKFQKRKKSIKILFEFSDLSQDTNQQFNSQTTVKK